jgi:hypothetical protein
MAYIRAGMMRSALVLTSETGPLLGRLVRAQAAGRTDEVLELSTQLSELSRAARRTMLERMMPPVDTQAIRRARRAREQFVETNQKRAAASNQLRAQILTAARSVPRRDLLSKTALARVVRARLLKTSPLGTPSVRTIRRYLPALKDL